MLISVKAQQKMEIKSITEDCARRSSLKGLPRIMNSREKSLKVLWIFGILVFFAICIGQVWMILGDYLEYSAIITVSETQLDFTENGVQLPNIKICNLNPIQSDHKLTLDTGEAITSVGEFLHIVDNATSCTNKNCTTTEEYILNDIKLYSTTYEGYFSYVGYRALHALGHTADNFIADCVLHVENQGFTRELDCDTSSDRVLITQHVSIKYGICLLITFPLQNDTWIVTGVSLTLHLDNSDDQFQNNLFFDSAGSVNQGSGALISLYEPGNDESGIILEGVHINYIIIYMYFIDVFQ